MINIYDFFEFVKKCKKDGVDPILRFERHGNLSEQSERLNPEASKEDAIVRPQRITEGCEANRNG